MRLNQFVPSAMTSKEGMERKDLFAAKIVKAQVSLLPYKLATSFTNNQIHCKHFCEYIQGRALDRHSVR